MCEDIFSVLLKSINRRRTSAITVDILIIFTQTERISRVGLCVTPNFGWKFLESSLVFI